MHTRSLQSLAIYTTRRVSTSGKSIKKSQREIQSHGEDVMNRIALSLHPPGILSCRVLSANPAEDFIHETFFYKYRPLPLRIEEDANGGLEGPRVKDRFVCYLVHQRRLLSAARGFSRVDRSVSTWIRSCVTEIVYRAGRPTMKSRRGKVVLLCAAEAAQAIAPHSETAAAHQIVDGMRSGKTRILIGSDARIQDRIARLLPRRYAKMLFAFMKNMLS